MKHATTLLVGFLGLFAARANAGPVDDVIAGEELYLVQGGITFERQDHITVDQVVTKAPGTLNFTVDARSLGYDVPLAVPFTGSSVGNVITWTTNQVYEPTFDTGEGIWIQRLTATLRVAVDFMPGDAPLTCAGRDCNYSARMIALPGSFITVAGWYGPHWFDRRFDVTTGELRGGLPVPRLAGFTVRQRLFCTSDVRRDMPATVRLAAAAGSRGAFVQVGTALPGQATRTIWVPPGQREQNLNIPIPAGTEGAYSAYASSGGVIVQRAIVVRPPVDCAPGEDPNSFNYLAPRAVEPLLGFCGPPCFARLQMNARGELIISGAQGTFLHSPQTGLHWINGYVGAGTLSGVTLGDAGHIAGTITDPQGAVQGFTLGPLDPDAPIAVHKLPSFSPVAVNAYGVIAGARHGNKGPAVWRDRAVVPLDFGLGEPLEPVAIDDQGFLLVRGVQGGWTGLSDYRRVKPLAVGAQPVRASAMSSSGLVAGAVVLDGVERPYIHDALSGKTTVLDVPAGYAGARAVDANSAGWVLVQAAPRADKRGPGVFLYQPGQPVRPLASFLAEPSDVEIIKGLAIADSGDVLVRGVRRGVVGHFVLQAWIKPFEPESK